MSSLARRLQIRIWKKMNKKPFNHTSNHHARMGSHPRWGTPLLIGAAWPLLASQSVGHDATNFKPDEVSS